MPPNGLFSLKSVEIGTFGLGNWESWTRDHNGKIMGPKWKTKGNICIFVYLGSNI